MSHLTLPTDQLELESIARRQKLEAERKQRFFNPRTRCLGIDIDALQDQVAEKKQQKQHEKERDYRYDEFMNQSTGLLSLIESKRKEKERQDLHDLAEFRSKHQQPFSRREWDLNSPLRLKEDSPARIGDDDLRCGVSSLQKFEGEDLKEIERNRLQKLQVRAWAYEGRMAKERKRREEQALKEAEREYMAVMEARRKELLNLEAKYRHDKDIAVKNANQALAEEKRCRDEAEARRRGIVNTLVVPAMADLQLDRPHIWKYMSDEERQRILSEEKSSKKDLQERAAEKRKEEEEWHAQSNAIAQAAELVEAEKQRLVAENAKQVAVQNAKKAQEDRDREFRLNRVIYTNKPTDAYFGQFNTSSR